ncbi:MAG: DUF5058 family protein [Emergencia timonensis]|uniref:DUF5058 family protein n=1 Tax=Emergencia timonensis TaxID=1776384 RepID=UPI00082F9798|nr:DUF5058 family protein [Emergencia timonensis]WNX90192.1 DUF5058 family protein [Emergencia timonensis]
MNYLDIANAPVLWYACIPLVILVLAVVLLICRKTLNIARKAGISVRECRKAFRTGAISAIGPSFAVFIVMVGLMSAIGTPMSWMRLSVIGSADAELLHAGLGASAVGQNLGSDEYNAVGYIASIWAMSTLGISWLINIFLIPSANKIEAKIKHRDDKLLQVVSVSCMIGIMSYMTVQNVIVGWDMAAAAAGAISSQLCLTKLSEKKTWLKEYVLGISMIIGMAVGMAASGV